MRVVHDKPSVPVYRDRRPPYTVQTVALLFLRDDGGACVVHVYLASPERAFVPRIDWDAGFSAALNMSSASIVSPDLTADRERLIRDVLPLAPAEVRALVLRVAHRCWSGRQEVFTRADLLAEVRTDTHAAHRSRSALPTTGGPSCAGVQPRPSRLNWNS